MGILSVLNKKIINVSGNVIGLDLSDLSIKVIQLERKGKKNVIADLGSAEMAIGSISGGEIVNKENVIAAIKKAISNAKPRAIKAKNVICSLPETKAFLRIINIPRMKEKEVEGAIKWEIEANIPLPIDQVYYDWQLLDKNFSREDGNMSVLIVAVSQDVVNQFTDIIEQAGLTAANMEIESIAQARSLLDRKEKEKTTLVIDIGDRRTSFLISVDNIPCFTSSLPLSAGSLTDIISKTLNINIEEAERRKIEHGIGSAEKNDPVFRAVQPVLENLASEIEKSMDFYLSGLKYSPSIDNIIICGGGARTKGIIDYLSKRLNKEITLGNPWVNLDIKDDALTIKKDESIQYSTAVGLALKGLYENFY
ncbi:cell division protein FtsA [bacterium BMS3Abin15]|nr:cell division protein FtsA [bacterium BMS3Abin15]HDZ85090.1 type IV pilus assembly protein PilM [Candidatus Moranbacteria bacterium]